MEIFIFLPCIILISYLVYNYKRNEKYNQLQEKNNTEVELIIGNILNIITIHLLVQPCTRCYEDEMKLQTISPKGRSISYTCTHCNKKLRATAGSKEAEKLIIYWDKFSTLLNEKFRLKNIIRREPPHLLQNKPITPKMFNLPFTTTEPVMPYEQTTREHISETIRGEIWRRDQGKCVVCNSKENLQYDHIIPVSKGGATSVTNLQLLCRSCNQKKGATI